MKSLCLFLLVLGCLTGCNRHPDRASVEGTVSFQGQLVERGTVELHPLDGTTGPMVGSVIENGRFRIPAEKGPLVGGTYRVRILGMKKTGQKQVNRDRSNAASDIYVNVIPVEYNSQSKLTVVVSEDEPNRLEYAL